MSKSLSKELVDCVIGEFCKRETCISVDKVRIAGTKSIPLSFIIHLQLKTQETQGGDGGNGSWEIMKPIGLGGMWIVNNDHVLMTEKEKRQAN